MTFKVRSSKNCQRFKRYLMEKIEILIIMKRMMMMAVIWKRLLIHPMAMNEIIINSNELFRNNFNFIFN